jgi:hypothetical protein
MNTPEISRLTRYLEELESIQSVLLRGAYVVQDEDLFSMEVATFDWVDAVTRMQRLQNDMHDGLMKARLLALNETEPAPKKEDSAAPKEHPEDFAMRVEYVLHAFNRLADHCEYKKYPDSKRCNHPKNDFGCFVNDCPLLAKATHSHE